MAADPRDELLGKIDSKAEHFGRLSRQIWELAEVGYKENRSSDLLKSELRSAGFHIQDNVAGIPTAFSASWGQGKPVIGILGEYDALPGLSQLDIPEKKARVAGAAGHGCGHNLFGAASALAAISIKDHLAAQKIPGTPGHSWQSTACSGMSIGRKGMVLAAKTLALTALDLFSDPKQVEAARASFNKRRAGHEYRSRLPAGQKPPLNYRDSGSQQ